MVKVGRPEEIVRCAEEDIPFFYGFPVEDWTMLPFLKELGSKYVYLSGDLFFQMDMVKKFEIPVRAIPNTATRPEFQGYVADMPNYAISSSWFRPEDVEYYEPYVAAIEFADVELSKERALFRIYKEEKEWPGGLNYIISNLNENAEGRLINAQWLAPNRLNCGRKCNKCQLCYRIIATANYDKLLEYKRETVDS